MAWLNTGGVARVFRHHWDGMMKASEQGIPWVHPTQKPIALMKWCILQAGTPARILDPWGADQQELRLLIWGLSSLDVR